MPPSRLLFILLTSLVAAGLHACTATSRTYTNSDASSRLGPAVNNGWSEQGAVQLHHTAVTATTRTGMSQRNLQPLGKPTGRVVGGGTISLPNYVPPDVLQQGAIDIAIVQQGSAIGICVDVSVILSDPNSDGVTGFLALLPNQSVVIWGTGSVCMPANATANVTAIAAGTYAALALLSDGTVVPLNDVSGTWGPETVPELMQTNVSAIWISGDTRCARLHNGTVVVWENLNNKNVVQVIDPKGASGAGTTIIGFAAGQDKSSSSILITLRANGSVVPERGISVIPRVLQSNVVAITSGFTKDVTRMDMLLALLKNGSIVQWSYGAHQVQYPLSHTGFKFTSIAAPSFAITDTGSVVSWDVSSLEDTSKNLSISVQGGIISMVFAKEMSLALKPPGPFNVVGFNGAIIVPASATIPAGVSAGLVTQVAAGDSHAIALQVDGRVVVWGDNSYGQLSVPQGLADVVQVSAAASYCAAVTWQGSLYVWGDKRFDPPTAPTDTRLNVAKVAAGSDCIFVLLTDGSVTGWCDQDLLSHSAGDYADDYYVAPSQNVSNIPSAAHANVSDIAVGSDVAIAVLSNGSVVQWGTNNTTPKLHNVASVALGQDWAAAILQNGSLVLWPTSINTGTPQFDPDLHVREVTIGLGTSVAPGLLLLENGTLLPLSFCIDDSCPDINILPNAQSGVMDMALGKTFSLVLKATSATSPSTGLTSNATHSGTISFVLDMSASSNISTNKILQRQFGQQLEAAMATYFNTSGVVLNVSGQAHSTGLQHEVIAALLNITATWQASDTTTPAVLQQQVSQLQQHPAAALPAVLLQTYGIDTRNVTINNLKTSGFPQALLLPSPVRIDSPTGLASPELVSTSALQAASPSTSKKISKSAIAGIAVGCMIGVAAVAAITVVVYRQWKGLSTSTNPRYGMDGNGATVIPAKHVKIAGLPQGELFVLATAQNYTWIEATVLAGEIQAVEAGLNDTQLDKMLQGESNSSHTSAPQQSPAVQLSKDELRQQVQLLSDGLLGRGATALVFKCVWPSRFGPNALLAAKVLHNGYEADLSVLSSFAYEAKLLAGIQHPHVVKLYGYCLDPPTVCLILELLPCSLKDVLYKAPSGGESSHTASTVAPKAQPLSRRSVSMNVLPGTCAQSTSTQCLSAMAADGGMHVTVELKVGDAIAADSSDGGDIDTLRPATLPQIVRISTDIAAGLAYLHSQPAPAAIVDGTGHHLPMATTKDGRIVHRDLKPANILFNSQGVAKISDLGLARQHDHTTFATINMGAGTLPYMAPELLISSKAGVSGAACTNRVDIYSLGIIMWELLMGQPPWKGMAAASIMAAVTNRRRLPLPGDVQSEDREHAIMDMPLLKPLPAHSHTELPKMCQIIQACWQQRELRRPTAVALHGTLSALQQQLEQQQKEQVT